MRKILCQKKTFLKRQAFVSFQLIGISSRDEKSRASRSVVPLSVVAASLFHFNEARINHRERYTTEAREALAHPEKISRFILWSERLETNSHRHDK